MHFCAYVGVCVVVWRPGDTAHESSTLGFEEGSPGGQGFVKQARLAGQRPPGACLSRSPVLCLCHHKQHCLWVPSLLLTLPTGPPLRTSSSPSSFQVALQAFMCLCRLPSLTFLGSRNPPVSASRVSRTVGTHCHIHGPQFLHLECEREESDGTQIFPRHPPSECRERCPEAQGCFLPS